MLHLIPVPIADNALHTLPQYLLELIPAINFWVVEDLRTARRFIKSVNKEYNIDASTFVVLDKHKDVDTNTIKQAFDKKIAVGLLSESGCPAIADPGSHIVALAHQMQVKVIPHIGPSSLLLALMASGMQGQKFYFHGYLPAKNPALKEQLKIIENNSFKENCTQLFIETPYRNNFLLDTILQTCKSSTLLTIATDISGTAEFIATKPISDWKKLNPNLEKLPTVWCLLAI
jgi:16S rRNA (cytidine1402-2'-O)-methyltransferase